MREIRFRAWDTKEKKMCYDVNVYSDAEGPWWAADWRDETGNNIASFDSSSGVIMQFTGLYDVDGKPVYEGDIFNYKHDKRAEGGGYIAGTSAYHPENAIVVEFEDGMFVAGGKPLYDVISFSKIPGHRKEVVGNIYEHPDMAQRGDDEG